MRLSKHVICSVDFSGGVPFFFVVQECEQVVRAGRKRHIHVLDSDEEGEREADADGVKIVSLFNSISGQSEAFTDNPGSVALPSFLQKPSSVEKMGDAMEHADCNASSLASSDHRFCSPLTQVPSLNSIFKSTSFVSAVTQSISSPCWGRSPSTLEKSASIAACLHDGVMCDGEDWSSVQSEPVANNNSAISGRVMTKSTSTIQCSMAFKDTILERPSPGNVAAILSRPERFSAPSHNADQPSGYRFSGRASLTSLDTFNHSRLPASRKNCVKVGETAFCFTFSVSKYNLHFNYLFIYYHFYYYLFTSYLFYFLLIFIYFYLFIIYYLLLFCYYFAGDFRAIHSMEFRMCSIHREEIGLMIW